MFAIRSPSSRALWGRVSSVCYSSSSRHLRTPASYTFRTDDNIIMSTKELIYPNEDMFTFFSKKFLEYGDKVAIVDETRGTSVTYNEIVTNARKLASFFDKQGYKTSERIAINTPNCLQYCHSLLGTLANGMVFNTANSAYTSLELNTLLKNSNPRALISCAKQMDTSKAGIEGTTVDLIICVDDVEINDSGIKNMSEILANGDADFKKDLSNFDPKKETGYLLYSSGTTGVPKGVEISHRALVSNVVQVNEFMEGFVTSSILSVLPMYHIYGIAFVMMVHLYNNCTLHVLESFIPEKFLSVIQERKIERLPIVPPIALFMMNHPMVKDYDLSSLRSVTVGAAPMDEVATSKFYETFPNVIMQQGYGMTETNITHSQPKYKHLQKAGSCGIVYPGTQCKIRCIKTGETLGPYEQGELCLKGPQLMTGYLNNEEATFETIDGDGWVRSGDLAYFDEDLNFYVVDRLKELIKYKALQIAPAELEDILLGNSEIVDACIIGIPCERAGEIPRAYIVKKQDSKITEEDVKMYIAERLSDHKHLRGGVRFVDELPKSAAGKLLRRHLKDQYLASIEGVLNPSHL